MDELQDWLEENWDPDLTVGEWWERLGMSGWAAPTAARRLLRRGPVAGRRARRPADDRRSSAPLGAPVGLRAAARRADHRDPRHARADRALRPPTSSPAAGVVPAVQRARRRLRPRRPHDSSRSATATSGSSTARRCGRPAARSPTSACSSPAPTPTRRSTRASPSSRSTCTSRASRSGRCAR